MLVDQRGFMRGKLLRARVFRSGAVVQDRRIPAPRRVKETLHPVDAIFAQEPLHHHIKIAEQDGMVARCHMGVCGDGIMRHIGGRDDVMHHRPVRSDAIIVGFARIQRHPIGTGHRRDQPVDHGALFGGEG